MRGRRSRHARAQTGTSRSPPAIAAMQRGVMAVIHDIATPRSRGCSRINWSPPFPGGTHTAPAARTGLAVVVDERTRKMRQRRFIPSCWMCACRKTRCRTRCPRRGSGLLLGGSSGTACTRTAPARSAARTPSSRPTTTPASACSTSGRLRAECLPGAAGSRKLIDPRPNVRLAAKHATSTSHGRLDVISDWRRHACCSRR